MPDAPATALGVAVDDVRRIPGAPDEPTSYAPMWDDWSTWHARLGRWYSTVLCPKPTKVGGLPEGWQIRAARVDPLSHFRDRPGRLFLVSRDGGGWGAVRRIPDRVSGGSGPDRSQTVLNHHGATLGELYATICPFVDAPSQIGSGRAHTGYEQMIREFIADAYDDTDPDERAERMLVALGARPRLVPASLV